MSWQTRCLADTRQGRLSFGGQTLENARNIKFHMKHGVALVPPHAQGARYPR